MNAKRFIVAIILILGSWKVFPDPICDNIISIQAFEKLDNYEKTRSIHPYLSLAFCQKEKNDEYLSLYLNTFSNQENVLQRLEELKVTLHKIILKDDTIQFFDFFGEIISHLENNHPDIQKELVFINIKFTYFNHKFGITNACSYLLNHSDDNFNNQPKNTDLWLHYLKLSKCAASSDDYNNSVFYLLQALTVAKSFDYPDNLLKTGHVYNALSKRYFELEDFKNTAKYADSSINTFLPDFKSKIGLGVGFENKALAIYRLENNLYYSLDYLDKAQNIYKKTENFARYHFTEKLKAEILLEKQPDVATEHLFNYINYFYKNKRRVHYTNGWLLAEKIVIQNRKGYLTPEPNVRITHRQIIDTLTALLPNENLQNQLQLSTSLIKYYSENTNKDSIIKYNLIQNELEAARNEMSIKHRKANLDLYLTNYQKEEQLKNLNFLNQKQSYQNKLLIGLTCFVVIALVFYYLYKRKQKQTILTKVKLQETEHEKLKTQQKLKEEMLLRKEKDEKLLKLAYDNEIKRKQLLQLKLKEKQNEVEAAQLEKQSSLNLLQEIFSTLKDDKVNRPSHLLKRLQSNEIITKHNDSLKEVFKSISPELMKSLEKINPNLTDHDVLYCALIRQNYNTKEIANFLNISPKSVNQHKYRLKNKLQINKNISITEFLKKLS